MALLVRVKADQRSILFHLRRRDRWTSAAMLAWDLRDDVEEVRLDLRALERRGLVVFREQRWKLTEAGEEALG